MSAKPEILAPFIRKWEGGLSRNQSDAAKNDACPYPLDGIHWHTNAGITWPTWVQEYGSSLASANVFYSMPQNQWMNVFTKYFWNKNQLSSINSQRIANVIGNWTWGSGNFYPDKHVQHVLNTILTNKIAEDGVLGKESIDEINEAPEEVLYQALIAEDEAYLKSVAANLDKTEPGTGSNNIQGWLNRMADLVKYNESLPS